MKRLLLSVFFFLSLMCIAFAESGDIECTTGSCDGWVVKYEKTSMNQDDPAIFYFENETGKPAFNLSVIINYYDFFDKHLGRIEQKHPGPIHKQLSFKGVIPKEASKITCEIYYSDKYNAVDVTGSVDAK